MSHFNYRSLLKGNFLPKICHLLFFICYSTHVKVFCCFFFSKLSVVFFYGMITEPNIFCYFKFIVRSISGKYKTWFQHFSTHYNMTSLQMFWLSGWFVFGLLSKIILSYKHGKLSKKYLWIWAKSYTIRCGTWFGSYSQILKSILSII